jgi:uncharacterized membrane protein YeiH
VVTPSPTLQLVLDLVGVFVFALSGALVGVRQKLDIFGVIVLSVAAGLGGGLLRDMLLGATPPPALADGRHIAVTVLAGGIAFVLYGPLTGLARSVRVGLGTALRAVDAAGLGVFTVAGTSKALAYGLGPVGALVLGVLTGVGGGVVRDVLAGQVPVVLQRELYAVPALAGAGIVVLAVRADRYGPAVVAGAAVFVFRLVAVVRDWHAPRALS